MTFAHRCHLCGTLIHRSLETCPSCRRPAAYHGSAWALGRFDAEEGLLPHEGGRFDAEAEHESYLAGYASVTSPKAPEMEARLALTLFFARLAARVLTPAAA